MSGFIDSHHHIWKVGNFSYPWMPEDPCSILRKDYMPDKLYPFLERFGIKKTILVQADLSLDETNWLLDIANQHDFICGVVGWVNLKSDHVVEDLLRLKEHPKFVGLRCPYSLAEGDCRLLDKENLRGLKAVSDLQIPYDLLIRPQHLDDVCRLIETLPDLKVVINHAAKPLIAKSIMDPWSSRIKEVAQSPNVYCKVSGLFTEMDPSLWKLEDSIINYNKIAHILTPYMAILREAFGLNRLMWGSDWPVSELAVSHKKA